MVQVQRLLTALQAKRDGLKELKTKKPDDLDIDIEIANIVNKIEDLQDSITNPPKLQLTGEDKVQWDAQMKAYEKRVADHDYKRGRAFGIITGQITTDVENKLKTDSDHDRIMLAQRPILLKDMIDKHTL